MRAFWPSFLYYVKMYRTSSLYKFQNIHNPHIIQKNIKKKLQNHSIKGTILIGEEGINGTISSENIISLNKALNYIKSLEGFDDIDIKHSLSFKNPFVRLKVKLKTEIVTIGDTSIKPNDLVGKYVEPLSWNKLVNDKDVLLIDTRNNYEISIGAFKNAINPNISKFRHFPDWLKSKEFSTHDKKNKKFAMYCTGGIRCEKASSLMKKNGFKNIYHLKGGILKYFESIPKKDSAWRGECFVFDDRVSLKHDLSEGTFEMCHGCRMPISKEDKKSQKYIKGVSCHHCHDTTSKEQKLRYMSRQKQINLAKKRNQKHIGPRDNKCI